MTDAGGILALDLSSRTGWAYGRRGGRPVGGVWALPRGEGNGAVMAGLVDALADAATLFRPALLVVEAPLSLQASRNAAAARHQLALAAAVELLAYRRDIPVREENAATVRKSLFGSARPWAKPGAVATKERWVVEAARRSGYDIHDNNHADALFLWLYANKHLGGGVAPLVQPDTVG